MTKLDESLELNMYVHTEVQEACTPHYLDCKTPVAHLEGRVPTLPLAVAQIILPESRQLKPW